jgi:3D (Asp-Asp-Asp) domain-containing protein
MRRVALALLLLLCWPHPITADHLQSVVPRVIEMTATAYCPTGYPTRSGRMPQVGRTVAVDTSIIPLGSRVRVNGREYVAEDTGRLVKGRRLDLFVGSREEAKDFGVQLVTVEVEVEP